MPEVVIPDNVQNYAAAVPAFLAPKMPESLSNTKPEVAKPAEAPKEEPKPVAEAATTAEPVKEEQEAVKDEKPETTGKDPEKQSTRRFERRIDRAIRAKAEAQAKADLLEKELAAERAKSAQASADPTEPKADQFTDVEEYAKAKADWKAAKVLKEEEGKQREQQHRAFQNKVLENWEERVSEGVSEFDDFEEVVGDLKPTTPWGVSIMESEIGHKIAYYLGKHPKEAEDIFSKTPLTQARLIGNLEAKLSATPEAPKKPSKAPAPIVPVSGAATPQTPAVSDPMPFEQYMKVGAKVFRGR